MKPTCCLRLLLLFASLLLALHVGGVSADTPPLPASPAPQALSLADALTAMPDTSVADGSVVLTVQPGQVLPVPTQPADDITPMNTVQTPDTIAVRYGRSLQVFGHVLALAPPTMTILNTDPALADAPLGSLAVQHPETYLLGSLTPEQLRQAGGAGLAYSEMTPDQQSLLHALLPEPLEIVPVSVTRPDDKMDTAERANFDAHIKKVSGEALFGSLRFHAYLTASFYVHAPVGFGIGDTQKLQQTTGAYQLPFGGYSNMESRGKTTEKTLCAEFPNAPKAADLQWNRRDLERTVSLRGLTTVDELVKRLAETLHLELYADPHYGALPLLVRGDLKTPLASGEVMQALALCVCGTWRQVGPAYVLTDDVQGLGTRQQFLAEIGQVLSNRLSQAGKDAGTHLQSLDWMHSLSFVPGDIGALSPDQINTIQKEAGTNKGTLLWNALSPPLHTYLKNTFLHYGDQFATMTGMPPSIAKMGEDMKAAAGSITPNTPVDTTLDIRLAIELPGTGAMMLSSPYQVQAPGADLANAPAKPDVPAQVNSIVLDKPLRGVLCTPRTPAEARAVVAKLPKMGLNTLFLDVFTNGRTYFPNTALPPESAEVGGVLQAALDAAKPLHIAVYAVLDTLCWRKDGLTPHPQPWPKGYTADLTVGGETPDHAIQRRYAANSLMTDYDHPHRALASAGTEAWASPLDPAVRAMLPPLVRTLAAVPGLSGLVFQNTMPPGYLENPTGDGISLGYTLENRLAYLRARHIDPIDLSASSGDLVSVFVGGENFFEHYDVKIPTFDSNPDSRAVWVKLRQTANSSLLADCWHSARNAAPSLPLLLREDMLVVSAFDPWTDPFQPQPFNIEVSNPNFYSKITANSVLAVAFGAEQQFHLDQFVRQAQVGATKDQGQKAGGEVFDLVVGGLPESLVDRLDKLDVFLTKPQETPKSKTPVSALTVPSR